MRHLVLEDEEYRRHWFRQYLPGSVEIVGRVSDAICLLSQHEYDALWLDHDLGTEPEVGRDVAKWLIANPDVLPFLEIYVHSINQTSGPKMTRELEAGGRKVAYTPFWSLVAKTAVNT